MLVQGLTGTRSVSKAQAPVLRRACIARAAAAPPTPAQPYSDVALLPAEERAKLARQWGFDYIGKELPDDVRLKDIVKTLPKEVFEINNARGWLTCLTSLITFPLSLYLVHITPAALLPISWAIAGTAFTGWFVIGHDCGHRTFNTNKVVEDIVGNFFFAPLLYPFEPWRIKHNQHHAFTNKLVDDTAWHPVMKDEAAELSSSPAGNIVKGFLGSPLKLWASIFHWLIWHFDASKFTKSQMPRVIVSWASCTAFAAIAFPLIVSNFGWFGIVKYWLGPWLGYHFWMSTFTIVHHTAPHIPFKGGKEWNAAKSQLSGTVHCDFPRYNLRKATESLREHWGEYMTECTFNWRLVKTIVTECHVYDEKKNYVPFDYEEEKPFFALQRKYLPDSM